MLFGDFIHMIPHLVKIDDVCSSGPEMCRVLWFMTPADLSASAECKTKMANDGERCSC